MAFLLCWTILKGYPKLWLSEWSHWKMGLLRMRVIYFSLKKMTGEEKKKSQSQFHHQSYLQNHFYILHKVFSLFVLNEPQSHTSQQARWLSCSLGREWSHWISINTDARAHTQWKVDRLCTQYAHFQVRPFKGPAYHIYCDLLAWNRAEKTSF